MIPASLKDPRFTFDPQLHEYHFDSRQLANATSVTHRWIPPFDTDKIAARVAKRDGKTVDAVLKEWDAARDAGCALGTELHAAIEADLTGEPLPELTEEGQRRFALYDLLLEEHEVHVDRACIVYFGPNAKIPRIYRPPALADRVKEALEASRP